MDCRISRLPCAVRWTYCCIARLPCATGQTYHNSCRLLHAQKQQQSMRSAHVGIRNYVIPSLGLSNAVAIAYGNAYRLQNVIILHRISQSARVACCVHCSNARLRCFTPGSNEKYIMQQFCAPSRKSNNVCYYCSTPARIAVIN